MLEILPQTMILYEYDTIQFSYNVTLYLTVLCRAAPALNTYFAFRAPLCYEALNTKYGPAFNTKYSLKAGGRSECKIWVESGARSQHHI